MNANKFQESIESFSSSTPSADEVYNLPPMPVIPKRQPQMIVQVVDNPDSITRREDGTLQGCGFVLHKKGLLCLGDEPTDEQWVKLGEYLRSAENSIQWWIGDWMAYGDAKWGEDAARIASELGYSVNSIYEYTRVCRAIEFSIRIENLSFKHHQIVASRHPDDQRYWLQQAADNAWSARALANAMTGTQPPERLMPPEVEKSMRYLMSIKPQSPVRSKDMRLRHIQAVRAWLDQLEEGLG